MKTAANQPKNMSSDKLTEPTDSDNKALAALNYVPNRYRRWIREKAISRARTRIIVAGNDPKKLSPRDLEIVVKEEEDKIKASVREKGLLAVLAMLGINLFG